MALFGGKKKDTKAKADKPAEKKRASSKKEGAKETKGTILVRPRITEKAGNLTASRVYTFDVAMTADKRTIAKAVEAEYKVKPIAVNIVRMRGKAVRLRTKRGVGRKPSFKKAYVTLKEGDRIEFAS